MLTRRFFGIALIVVGVLALAYGGFTYTSATHDAKIGPIEFSVSEKETVNVPIWFGVVSLIGGILLVVVRPRG